MTSLSKSLVATALAASIALTNIKGFAAGIDTEVPETGEKTVELVAPAQTLFEYAMLITLGNHIDISVRFSAVTSAAIKEMMTAAAKADFYDSETNTFADNVTVVEDKVQSMKINGKIFAVPKAALEIKTLKEQTKFLYSCARVLSKHTSLTEMTLMEAAVKGAVEQFDSHSEYIPREKGKEFMEAINNQVDGVGFWLKEENTPPEILSVVDNSPASIGGLKAGDLLTHVSTNGKPEDMVSVSGMEKEKIHELIKGDVGQPIHLRVLRNGEEMSFDLVRDVINFPTVKSRMLKQFPDTGYIAIISFNENTTDEFLSAVEKLKATAGDIGLKKLILDLHLNSGGYLPDTIAVADALLDAADSSSRLIVSVGKSLEEGEKIYATPGDVTGGIPIVILMSGYSVSGAELLGGALKDYKRAVIFGTPQTHGKGSVQELYFMPYMGPENPNMPPMPEEAGTLKITNALYFLKNGSPQWHGIKSNWIVESNDGRIIENTTDLEKDRQRSIRPQYPRSEPEAEGTCTLKARFRGALGKDLIAELPEDYIFTYMEPASENEDENVTLAVYRFNSLVACAAQYLNNPDEPDSQYVEFTRKEIRQASLSSEVSKVPPPVP